MLPETVLPDPVIDANEDAPITREIPPPYTFAPLELDWPNESDEEVDIDDNAVQEVIALLEMAYVLLLTAVLPLIKPVDVM